MKRINSLMVVLAMFCMAGAAVAADVQPEKAPSEKKKVQPLVKKTKETPRDAKKAKAANGTTGGATTDPAGRNAARSKKQHDEAEKVIDNLK